MKNPRELCRRSSPDTFTDLKVEDNRNYAKLLRRTFDNVNVGGHAVILTPGRYNAGLGYTGLQFIYYFDNNN